MTFTFEGSEWTICNPFLLGSFNADNLVLCFLALNYFGISAAAACELLAQVKPAEGRLQAINGQEQGANPLVYIDFAHTPDALDKVLAALQQLGKNNIVTVFGCGGDKDKAKRPLMGESG